MRWESDCRGVLAAHGLKQAMANSNASNQLASHKLIETEGSTAAAVLGILKLSS